MEHKTELMSGYFIHYKLENVIEDNFFQYLGGNTQKRDRPIVLDQGPFSRLENRFYQMQAPFSRDVRLRDAQAKEVM